MEQKTTITVKTLQYLEKTVASVSDKINTLRKENITK